MASLGLNELKQYEDKIADISKVIFDNTFFLLNCLNFYSNFTDLCPQVCNWQYVMAWPTRRQTVIWIRDGLVYWWIFSSLGISELTQHLKLLINLSRYMLEFSNPCWFFLLNSQMFSFYSILRIITHAPVHVNDFRGVRARYVKRTG